MKISPSFRLLWVALLSTTLLSSCFELREEIYIKKNGSGNYSFLFDMSQMKPLLEAAMAFADSTDSDKDFLAESEGALGQATEMFEGMAGISNPTAIKDKENFKFGFQFDFQDVESLNDALSQMETQADVVDSKKSIYKYSKGTLERNMAGYIVSLSRSMGSDSEEGKEANSPDNDAILKSANYVFVIKTEGKIKNFAGENLTQVSERELKLTAPLSEVSNQKRNLQMKVKFK
ncbi:hypothetical protein [Hugenholtzia roseola]|uniref:hypothetical protein n=1 Tax=Hugenholtzia roseola TaxID=1002 RepID=UPI00041D524B|nr:hypothetical protein [Hugenholtzia roseola]